MRFGAISWLWALVLVPLVAALLWYAARLRGRLARRFADSAAWSNLTQRIWSTARRWRSILLLLSLALSILAVARPQWGARAVMLKRRGLDIVVALDVSKSMLATDIKPDRLTRAKREISGVLDRLAGDRIGLVVFAGDAFVQCPLTLDGAAARLLLDAVDARSAGRPGTSITEAIKTAGDMFETNEHQFKVMILVTDGESHEGDDLSAAQDAAKAGIRIYTVGVGTPSGEPIPEFDENGRQTGFKKDESGQVVLSKLDEVSLQKIALATEGRYFRAGPTEMEIDALFGELSKLEKKEMEGRLFTEFEERFQFLLLPAFLFLLAEFILPEVRPRRIAWPKLKLPLKKAPVEQIPKP
ncbi:MAG: VWA domain-containing protein [candidate division Zixibacteria bacterium]|nr:VWA domain-containing protein [candidate division Zixibacteria bacterium]